MKTRSDLIKDRLKTVIVNDKSVNIENLEAVLTSDITQILSYYMYMPAGSVKLKIQALDCGGFEVKITAQSDHLFEFGALI